MIAFLIFLIDRVAVSLSIWTTFTVLYFGLLTCVSAVTRIVATYGGPRLIQIAILASHRKLCGLCGETHVDISSPVVNAPAWSLSPPGINCSQECDQFKV